MDQIHRLAEALVRRQTTRAWMDAQSDYFHRRKLLSVLHHLAVACGPE